MEGSPEREAPAAALAAVLKHSSTLPPESTQVRGYDFTRGVDYRALLKAFGTTGFQATNFGRAVQQVNAMVRTGAGLLEPVRYTVLSCSLQNHIPVFSPALTDGSLGDMIFFHSYKNPGLVLDIVEDLRLINTQAIFAKGTGMIILGGGVVKHHIANANLMRNGADYAVYINTAQEFDGSDSGARPDEAVSWGKIRVDAQPVKVYADASLVFPLLVAETFAQKIDAFMHEKNED
ncbi:deoxyhypusine synthase [Piliocolobus tephrosceles]|uniref:deoxyhypusine synthase n=1 Tax=Piliocolobus tephrosceles TaxID=591936 RepID=UPI001300DEEE|nr:deoxyhypusine synthase [Piliocolobus tephrosceles]